MIAATINPKRIAHHILRCTWPISGDTRPETTIADDARVDLQVASWDYTQRYPTEKSDDNIDNTRKKNPFPKFGTSNEDGKGTIDFNWQVTAEGMLELHL